jgi:hypothetical protein
VTTPPAPATSPAASMSPCIPVAPAALVAACDRAFEVDGWAATPGFFLGAMDDGAADEEDGGEMTRFVHFSGSCKRSPLPGAPKMSWETTATYRAKGPFWFGRGTERIAQRVEESSVAR